MSTTSKSEQFSRIPCAICGASSSGYHFGAISCESCKVFFCRSLKRPSLDKETNVPYLHRCNGISGSNCQRCRFDKCLAAGMNESLICIGRHSAERRHQKAITLSKLAENNQLLYGHVSRRRTATNVNPKRKSPTDNGKQPVEESPTRPATSVAHPPATSSNVVLMNECRTFPQSESLMSEQIIEKVVQSIQNLHEIRTMPNCQIITPDMSMEAVWGINCQGLEAYTKIVSNYVKSLPGFAEVTNIADRVRLFNSAFHPLYSTQLALDYDAINHKPKFFAIEPGISQAAVLEKLPELVDIFSQLADSGVALSSAQFTRAELALLCALVFFNPTPYPQVSCPKMAAETPGSSYCCDPSSSNSEKLSGLVDQKLIQATSTYYWQAAERYIRATFPPEIASRRISLFYEMVSFFRHTAALAQSKQIELASNHPNLAKQNRYFYDMTARILANSEAPKHLRVKSESSDC